MKKRKLKRPAMPGAGRPAVYTQPRKISLLLEQKILEGLDAKAARLSIRRTTAVATAIREWIEQ